MQRKIPDYIHYLKLICILTIPLFLVTIYSFVDEEFVIGSIPLQKTSINQLFIKPEVPITDTLIIDTIFTPKQDTVSIDTTSQRILFFGDSMVEGLSKRMCQYAAENHHELLNVIWYSSSTLVWSKCDTLSYFIKKFKPNYIMITLGGNELFVKDLDKRDRYIKTIVKQVKDKPYIWIGPPNWKEDTGINKLIEQNVGKSHFFLSKNLKFDRSSDGAHPTFASASHWMDTIAVWMMKESQHPIRMNIPVNSSKKTGKTYMLAPPK